MSNNWNVIDECKQLNFEEIKKVQKKNEVNFSVCTLNLTGDLNIGSIIRSSCIFGAKKVIIFGRRIYDRRSSVGSQNYIDVERIYGIESNEYDYELFYQTMNQFNLTPVFVEQNGIDYEKHEPTSVINPCYVFGCESSGIPEDLIGNHLKISIPQYGVMRSLNVSVSAGIIINHVSRSLRSI